MAKLLVVEDSPSQAKLIQAQLEAAGYEVQVAANDDIAVEALKRGAASYVPKKCLHEDLLPTVKQLLALAHSEHPDRLLQCLQHAEATFLLDNDTSQIPALSGYVQNMLAQVHQSHENTLLRLGIALHEAMVNAIYHGNLQVSSDLREGDGQAFDRLVDERRRLAPYADRQVAVSARVSRTEAVIAVRDEGPGFDVSRVSDPTEPANLEKVSGRGLLLIRTFLDEVRFNSRGNEITMVKRREMASALA